MADPIRLVTDDDAGTPQSESKEVVPAKPYRTSAEHRVENNIPMCGDFGGVTPDGAPCTLIAGWKTPNAPHRTGRCYLHSAERQDEITEKKKTFIEKFMTQPMTARAAAEAAGVSFMTICRWRKQDEEFNKEVTEILNLATQARFQFIEDAATLRAMDPSNNADTLRIFMMKNLSGGKYRDVYDNTHSAPGGGPIQTVRHNVRWNIDGTSLHFFGKTAPRIEPPLPPDPSEHVASDSDDSQ